MKLVGKRPVSPETSSETERPAYGFRRKIYHTFGAPSRSSRGTAELNLKNHTPVRVANGSFVISRSPSLRPLPLVPLVLSSVVGRTNAAKFGDCASSSLVSTKALLKPGCCLGLPSNSIGAFTRTRGHPSALTTD